MLAFCRVDNSNTSYRRKKSTAQMNLKLLFISILIYWVGLTNCWIRRLQKTKIINGNWTERCFTDLSGTFLKSDRREKFVNIQTTLCHILCHTKGCSCTLTRENAPCILFFAKENLHLESGKMVPIGHNVALEKPTESSSEHTVDFRSAMAVDGEEKNNPFVSIRQAATTAPWLQVDLEKSYNISGIRAMSRHDSHLPEQFKSVEILVGNSSGANNNFSSFKIVHFIKDGPPSKGCWYYVRLELTEPYQFVALRRINDDDQAYIYLSVQELEVLV